MQIPLVPLVAATPLAVLVAVLAAARPAAPADPPFPCVYPPMKTTPLLARNPAVEAASRGCFAALVAIRCNMALLCGRTLRCRLVAASPLQPATSPSTHRSLAVIAIAGSSLKLFSWSLEAFFVPASSFSMRVEAFLSCLLKLFSPSVVTYTRPVEAFFHVRLHQFVAVAVAGRGLPHI